MLGPSLAGKRVRVFTNHPVDVKSGYNRQQYRELHWQNLTGRKFDVYDNFAAVTLIISGSFNYFFTIDGRYDILLQFRSARCLSYISLLV